MENVTKFFGKLSAINANTLTVSGTGLDKLTKADITIAGNTITSVTAATDGKTATVVLGALVTPNVEYTVKVKDVDYKITYSLVAGTASITQATYDDNRANQYVAFIVNGTTGNVPDLLANGYTVSFTATDKDGNTDKTPELFNSATTGKLNTNLVAGTTYKVQVTLTNGSTVIVAPSQEIKIENLDLAASAINTYEFSMGSVVLNSAKLVVGDTGSFTQLKVVIDGSEKKVTTNIKVESSNKAVASVATNGVVTAHTPGTTTLTLTYGNVKKEVVFTVVNEVRKINTVKVTKVNSDDQIYNVTAIKNVNNTVTVSPLDQYGDPMAAKAFNIESSDTAIATVASTLTSAADGTIALTITPIKAGSTTLLFKNPTNNTTLSTFGVNVTENSGIATKRLEVVAPKDSDPNKKSADNTLDLDDDKFVEYKLNQYTSEGIKNGSVTFTSGSPAYSVTSSDTTIATAAFTGSGDVLTITGVKKGTATISLKDGAGLNVGTITVTIVDTAATITGVSFKPQAKLDYAKTIDYKTFLANTEAAGTLDPVISGISISKATTNAIRLDVALGKIYIDTNGDADYTFGTDKDLGLIDLSYTTDSTNITVTSNSSVIGTGSKGTLIFKVKEIGGDNKIFGATSLEVDVK